MPLHAILLCHHQSQSQTQHEREDSPPKKPTKVLFLLLPTCGMGFSRYQTLQGFPIAKIKFPGELLSKKLIGFKLGLGVGGWQKWEKNVKMLLDTPFPTPPNLKRPCSRGAFSGGHSSPRQHSHQGEGGSNVLVSRRRKPSVTKPLLLRRRGALHTSHKIKRTLQEEV